VQQWVRRHEFILSRLNGQRVRELDFADDRLAICLRELSDSTAWCEIENQLGRRLVRVYDLRTDRVRLDATVGTVYRNPQRRIYATNEAAERLSLDQTGEVYRDQIIQENIFRPLHGKMLSITPLYVQREDHAQGLLHLLTLGSRVWNRWIDFSAFHSQ
jgi:transposase